MKNKVLAILLIIFLMYSGAISYVIIHEKTHKEIWNRYSVDSKIFINFFRISGITTPDTEQYYSNCNENCKMLHALNNIVGYNLAVLIQNLWIMILVVLIYNKLTKEKRK